VSGTSGAPSGVAPDVPPTPLTLAVLGDSIAYGTGARSAADALGPRLSAALTADGFDVSLHVLAVPGAVSRDLAPQVERARRLGPDLAVVVIGANDLARFVPADRAVASLASALRDLRALGTDVVLVPAPDMSMVPFVPAAFRPAVQAACRVLQREQTAVAEAAGCTVALVAAEVAGAFGSDPALFSSDRFHPSSAGYARIAAALAPFVLDAARARRDASAA
jgi:lysophospholipase L1-like esterase